MGGCSSVASGCDYGSVSASCKVTMDGSACESGNYTITGVDSSGSLTLEPGGKINSVTIDYVSSRGKLTINADDDFDDISLIKFGAVSSKGRLIVNSKTVRKFEGNSISSSGYACVTSSDYNSNEMIQDISSMSSSGKFGNCFMGGNGRELFWLFMLVVLPISWYIHCYFDEKKKKQEQSNLPPLPTTDTKPPVPTPEPPSKYQEEPEIDLNVPAPQTGNNNNIVQELQQLKNLVDTGALTNEEFQNAKAKLLNS